MSSNMNALQEVQGSYNEIKGRYNNLVFMNPEHPDKRIEIIDIVEQYLFLRRFMKSNVQMYWTKRPYNSINNWIIEIVNRFNIDRTEIYYNYVEDYDEIMRRGRRATSMFRANNAFQPSGRNVSLVNLNPTNPTPPRSPAYITNRPGPLEIHGGKTRRKRVKSVKRKSKTRARR